MKIYHRDTGKKVAYLPGEVDPDVVHVMTIEHPSWPRLRPGLERFAHIRQSWWRQPCGCPEMRWVADEYARRVLRAMTEDRRFLRAAYEAA